MSEVTVAALQLVAFAPLFHEPQEILRLVRVAAFSRTGDPEQQRFARQRAYLEKTFGAQVTVVENPHVVDISSTRLRQLLPEGREYLPEAVYGYILRQRLYGTHADLKHLTPEELRLIDSMRPRAGAGEPRARRPPPAGESPPLGLPGLASFLGQIRQRLEQGIGFCVLRGLPVERYYHWCFLDNFEWTAGESARFGIVEVDYPTQRRTVKQSGAFFRDTIAAGGVTEEIFERYVRDQAYRTNAHTGG